MPRIEALALVAALLSPASAQKQSGTIAWVIDGDTFRLASGERIRIAGIDAPETQPGEAKCRAEIAHGKAATRTAIPLLKGRAVTFVRVGRSYNRTVAIVTLDGQDLAGLLVARGVAAWWPRGRPKPDWCRP